MAGAEAKAELVSSRYVLVRGARRRAANWSCTAERVRAIERPGARMGHLSGWRGGALAGAPGGPAGEEKTPPRDAVRRVRHGDGARGCWCWCRVDVRSYLWAYGRYLGISPRSVGLPIFGPKIRFWIEKITLGERVWKAKGDQNFLLISNPLRNAFAPSIL